MDATSCYRAGKLREAIDVLSGEVKQKPTDVELRGRLAEMLCVGGRIQRADLQLEALGRQDPDIQMGISLLRQLIRAEQARQDYYNEGRVPEFLSEPSKHLELQLQASIAVRESRPADAVEFLENAEQARPSLKVQCNGATYDEFRDLDDLNASFFEVLTSTGKYYWVPFEHVVQLQLRKPTRPRDLLWVEAEMSVRGGPDGVVYLPAIYAPSNEDSDESALLGRSTDWSGGDGQPVRGCGLRTFLVGEESLTLLQLEELAFEEA